MSDEIFVYNTYRDFVPQRIPNKCSGYGLGNLIKEIEFPIGVEIGCADGFTTEHLLESNPNLSIYCIDPWVNYIDWNGNNLNEREEIYKIFLDRTSKFGDRVKVLRKFSDDAVTDIPDNSLDFIFIDGLHTYDQVTRDMTNYYPKLKNNGIFSGHFETFK